MATFINSVGKGLARRTVTTGFLGSPLFILFLAATTPSAAFADGSEKFFNAAQRGNLSAVKKLVRRVDLEVTDGGGRTALMVASQEGHAPVVEFLIARGAEVNAVTIYGWSSLLAAAQYGQGEVTRILLKNGAVVETKNIYGETPLIAAARSGHLEVVRALLDRDAEVNARDQHGETALKNARSNMHGAVVELLIKRGAVE